MTNAWTDYAERARQLLLAPEARLAFVRLNEHADAEGACPGCGERVSAYESDRLTHARCCAQLAAHVAQLPPAAVPDVQLPPVTLTGRGGILRHAYVRSTARGLEFYMTNDARKPSAAVPFMIVDCTPAAFAQLFADVAPAAAGGAQ